MPERSVTHDTFAVERTYDASPARFSPPGPTPTRSRVVRVAGRGSRRVRARLPGRRAGVQPRKRMPGGNGTYTYDARYQDIVPDERIVYAYDMHLEDTRISVSLSTVELKPDGDATRLIYTEQGRISTDSTRRSSAKGARADCSDALEEYLARNR